MSDTPHTTLHQAGKAKRWVGGWLPEELYQRVDRHCREEGRKKVWVLEVALGEYLDRVEGDQTCESCGAPVAPYTEDDTE